MQTGKPLLALVISLLFSYGGIKAQVCNGFSINVSPADTTVQSGQHVYISAHINNNAQTGYDTIDMQYWFNQDWATIQRPMIIPSRLDTLGGVPFTFGCDTCNNFWLAGAGNDSGPDPRILALPVFQKLDTVFSLITTYYGADTPSLAAIELKTASQVIFTKALYGDIDIRDYNPNTYTNNINGTSTVNVFTDPANASRRLDMVQLAVPLQFKDSLIDSILYVDNGTPYPQRLAISGVTVKTYVDTVVTYRWSNGDTTANINVSPTQTTVYYVTVTTQNGLCVLTDSAIVHVNPKTGTISLTDDKIVRIFPNPANGEIFISGLPPQTKISITNLLGQVLIQEVAESDFKTIDVSLLPTGVYFVNNRMLIKE